MELVGPLLSTRSRAPPSAAERSFLVFFVFFVFCARLSDLRATAGRFDGLGSEVGDLGLEVRQVWVVCWGKEAIADPSLGHLRMLPATKW